MFHFFGENVDESLVDDCNQHGEENEGEEAAVDEREQRADVPLRFEERVEVEVSEEALHQCDQRHGDTAVPA